MGNKVDEQITDAQVLTGIKIPFTPIDDRVLVKPMPVEKIEKTLVVPDEEANKDKKLGEDGDVLETKEEVKEVEMNVRKGVVLRIGQSIKDEPFKEGDTVVFNVKSGMAFEAFKDSILLKRFEILGTWDK